jgi:hypothetical protein
LVDDDAEWEEAPIKLPQEVFSHVSVVYKSEVIVIGGDSGDVVFLPAEIFNLVFPTENLSITFPMLGIISW